MGQMVLPEELIIKADELMPKHVAVIMDGNRRWAKERLLKIGQGHEQSRPVVMNLISLSSKWAIKVLSLFAFSSENWTRPKEEVDLLMGLIEDFVQTFIEQHLDGSDVRLTFIGDRSNLPESLLDKINSVEEQTRVKKGLHVLVALNYSGKYDIIQATKKIANKVVDGTLQIEEINETLFEDELQTRCAEFANPDLLIRTSGEQRISNFMLWQVAYTELYFSNKLFPDFEEEDYVRALLWFQQRDRRFGGKKY